MVETSPTPISTSTFVTLARREDWPSRFTTFVAESLQEGVVLDWENFNCVSWAADAVEAMTGVDLYEDFRGKSDSPLSAYVMLRRAGFRTLSDIMASKLPEKALPFVARGDVVLVPVEGQWNPYMGAAPPRESVSADVTDLVPVDEEGKPLALLAICIADPPICWNLTENGPVRINLSQAVKAYDVGGALCLQQ